MIHCRYHARCCGGHFTSLEAFDAHREGPAGTERACTYPEEAALVERVGECRIADPTTPSLAVTIYEHARADRLREYRKAIGGREGLRTDAKRAAA